MNLTIEKRNIFTLDKKEWYFAHCISLDCKMGAGIAVKMKKKFHLGGLEEAIKNFPFADFIKVPVCFRHNGVLNLITKKKYYGKPTYETMKGALVSMWHLVDNNPEIKKIAMPKIGCGLDRLSWPKVLEIITEIFKDTDIEILVCHI